MIIIHTEDGVVYLVQEDDGAVKIYKQGSDQLLAEGELVQVAYGEISLTIGEKVVWRAKIVSQTE